MNEECVLQQYAYISFSFSFSFSCNPLYHKNKKGLVVETEHLWEYFLELFLLKTRKLKENDFDSGETEQV